MCILPSRSTRGSDCRLLSRAEARAIKRRNLGKRRKRKRQSRKYLLALGRGTNFIYSSYSVLFRVLYHSLGSSRSLRKSNRKFHSCARRFERGDSTLNRSRRAVVFPARIHLRALEKLRRSSQGYGTTKRES